MNDKRGRFDAEVLPLLDAAWRFARWLCHSDADADDVVQDAFLRAYRNFDTIRGTDVKAWLLTIVRNCHCTALTERRRRAHVPLPEDDDAGEALALTASALGPEAASIADDQARQLHLLMRCLPEAHREVLVLRELEDLGYRQIAQITNLPIGTVMSRLARARAGLKQQWLAVHPGDSREMR